MQIIFNFTVYTWTRGVLQVTQAGLFGDPIDELARFTVLVAGGQMQRGQLLRRVFVQRHAFVHHHRRREAVLWRGAGENLSGRVRWRVSFCLDRISHHGKIEKDATEKIRSWCILNGEVTKVQLQDWKD